MSETIIKAHKGNKNAMEKLYDENKQKIFYICLILTSSSGQAEEAAKYAFKNAFSAFSTDKITTEKEFLHLVISKAVEYCKKRIMKKNSKAFYLPPKKSLYINNEIKVNENETATQNILKVFSPLQKFIFVLDTVGGFELKEIASVFRFNLKAVEDALDAQQANIEKVISKLNKAGEFSTAENELLCEEIESEVPPSLDEYALDIIEKASKPIRERIVAKRLKISLIILAVCLVISGSVAFALTRPDESEAQAETTAASSSSDTSELLGSLLGSIIEALGDTAAE